MKKNAINEDAMMKDETTKIAAVLNQPTWFLCRCRVYDIDYAIRTIDAMGGGNTQPLVLIMENQTGSKPLTERPTNEQNEKEVY